MATTDADDTTSDTMLKVKYLQGKLTAKTPPDNHLMMKILKKLCQLPVTMEILQNTGIGKDINGLRKQEGKIGSMARGLVQKWKEMVRQTNRVAPAKTHPSEASRVPSAPPKKTESGKVEKKSSESVSPPGGTPKIKIEKGIDSNVKKIKPPNQATSNKSSTQESKNKAVVDSKKKDIPSQSPPKRKAEDTHKHASSNKVKKLSEKTKSTSPNRGLLVETVYAGSSSTAKLDSSYNDFMQNTRTPSSDSDSESSVAAKSHPLDDLNKKTKQKSVEKRSYKQSKSRRENLHHVQSDSDSEDSLSGTEHPLDRMKKKSSGNLTRKRSHKRTTSSESSSGSKSSDSERGDSPDSFKQDISESEEYQNGTYSSDSDNSFSAKEHPLDSLNKHNKASEDKASEDKASEDKASEQSDQESDGSHSSYSEDSIAGTEHPLDSLCKIKQEVPSDSGSESDSHFTKLKTKEKLSSKKSKSSVKKSVQNLKQEKHERDKRTKSDTHDSVTKKIKTESKPTSAKHSKDSSRKFYSSKKKSTTHSSASGGSIQIKKEPLDVSGIKSEKEVEASGFTSDENAEDEKPSVDSFDLPGQFNGNEDEFNYKSTSVLPLYEDPLSLMSDSTVPVKVEKADDVSIKVENPTTEKKPDPPVGNSATEKKPAPPVKPKKKKKRIVDDSEKTFENTGMSFADCLGALQTYPVRKLKKKPAAAKIATSVSKVSNQVSQKSDPKEKVKNDAKEKEKSDSKERVTSDLKSDRSKSSKSNNHISSEGKTNSQSSSSSKSKSHMDSSSKSTLSHSPSKTSGHSPSETSDSNSPSKVSNSNHVTSSSSVKVKGSDSLAKPKKSSHSSTGDHKEGVSKDSSKLYSESKHHSSQKKRSHESAKTDSHRHRSSPDDSVKADSHKTGSSSHDSSRTNSHRDKSSSGSKKSSKTIKDRGHKEKGHHKISSSSSAHKKHHERNSEGHKKSDRVKDGETSSHKSREESRQERKRKWSTSADEAIMKSPKAKKDPQEISLNLPDIQPDYKPVHMPVIEPRKKQVLTMDDPTRMIGSRQNRTKVFSGRVRNTLTDVPRLYDMCMDILCDNIDALDEVGGVPADILRPVLERCTPPQLFHLEDVNPHFLDDTEDLWKRHAEKDFRTKQPDEFESWREFYIRKYDERDAKLKSLSANIKASMAAKDPGRLTKMAYMDRPAKPPRNVKRAQAIHGTHTGDFVPKPACSSASRAPKNDLRDENHSSSSSRSSSSGGALARNSRAQPRVARVIAPMMQKSLKMFKRAQTRR